MKCFKLALLTALQLTSSFVAAIGTSPQDLLRSRSILKDAKERNLELENICGEWEKIAATMKGGIAHDNFGSAVATSADGLTIAMSAPVDVVNLTGDYDGYVKVVKYNPATGTHHMLGNKIIVKNWAGLRVAKAGSSIALSDDGKTIAIANVENENANTMSGGVNVYVLNEGARNGGSDLWEQVGER